jgi:hypothetical protein
MVESSAKSPIKERLNQGTTPMNKIKLMPQGSDDAKARGLMPVTRFVRLISDEPSKKGKDVSVKHNAKRQAVKGSVQPVISIRYDSVDCPLDKNHGEGQ